jgi:Lantibiotic dehydratase, N terminus
VSSAYQVAPIFLIRIAGVPFDAIEQLATPEVSQTARELFIGQSEPVADAEMRLATSLEQGLERSRTLLLETARKILPRYLVFGGESMRARATSLLESPAVENDSIPPRNARTRERERHLLLYIQRLAAKNDTLSEFGPSAWGKIDNKTALIDLAPRPGVAARETFLERWTAHAVAAAINADPEIFVELSPRLNPNGHVAGNEFIFADSGERVELQAAELEVLARCNGRTTVYSLGTPAATIRELIDKKILRCQMEVPALEPHAFAVLRDDVETWRAGESRQKWLSILNPIGELPQRFAKTLETKDREAIMDETRNRLQTLGAAPKATDRFLYSAANPIGEECFRESNFTIHEELINEVPNEAGPWIDLWRDSYAFIASRVAAGLRQILEKVSNQKDTALPLPAFLRACEAAKLPLTGPGLVGLAHLAFQEVKAGFRERMKPHADKAEYELTREDCHFVRQNFQYQEFDEYTYPSADLQIAAESADAVARGDYQWVLAELHPPPALLHHCMYWSCPAKPELNRALAVTALDRPSFHFGFFAADFTSHTTVRLFDAMPELANFVAPERSNPRWRTVSPAEAEVYVDGTSSDVCLRTIGKREHLGSFVRAWLIPLGFHPFQFGMTPHMPRLRCGKVIVQRRAWVVTETELMAGNYTGVSRDLVVAIERLREQKNWPRFIYIRPTEQALRRSGAVGRDKDTKPVFIDLESYLFLEIFHRWLTKSGELEVTEMLPAPDQLLWKEPDGRRTFELRTLIIPRR